VLEAAGITELPRTWDEFDAACAAVAALPDGPAHVCAWPVHGWLFQQAVAQQDGLLADNDNGRTGRAEKLDFASDEMIAYVTWWKQLHDKGYYNYTGREADWLGSAKAFAGQDVAFTIASSHEANTMVRAGLAGGFDVKAGWLPHNGRVPNAGAIIGGDAAFLAAGLDKATEDCALAFLQDLIEARHAASYHKTADWIPITRSAIDVLEREGWFVENPHLRVATDQLLGTTNTPASRGALLGDFAGVQHVLDEAVIDVLVNDADPATRLAQATTDAQAMLDEYAADHQRPADTLDQKYLKIF